MNSTASYSPSNDPNNPYDYVPSEAACIFFVALFGISTIVHFIEAVSFSRRQGWWIYLFPTVLLCGCGEVLGWSGRLWSSQNVDNQNAFMIQIVCLIIAPTPLLAAIFMISSRVITRLGPSYSRLSPRNYSRVFLTFDIVSLVVQAGGGALTTSNNTSTSILGGHIMLAGIALSLTSITIFSVCIGEFFYRYMGDRPVRVAAPGSSVETLNTAPARQAMGSRLRLMIWGMGLTTLFLLIRAIYRTIELSGGFNSAIMREQVVFDILDGGMVALAMYTLNVFHPGLLLRQVDEDEVFALDKPRVGNTLGFPSRPGSAEELLERGQAYSDPPRF